MIIDFLENTVIYSHKKLRFFEVFNQIEGNCLRLGGSPRGEKKFLCISRWFRPCLKILKKLGNRWSPPPLFPIFFFYWTLPLYCFSFWYGGTGTTLNDTYSVEWLERNMFNDMGYGNGWSKSYLYPLLFLEVYKLWGG